MVLERINDFILDLKQSFGIFNDNIDRFATNTMTPTTVIAAFAGAISIVLIGTLGKSFFPIGRRKRRSSPSRFVDKVFLFNSTENYMDRLNDLDSRFSYEFPHLKMLLDAIGIYDRRKSKQ